MNNPIKKIVAVGGGENGRINSKGIKMPYELGGIDREIVRASGKEKPRFLFLAHSKIGRDPSEEEKYINIERGIFGDALGCDFRTLLIRDVTDEPEKAKEYLDWADIIYEGGGNTAAMVAFWRETGFDLLLRDAWEAGKLMCGISAGAICWFSMGNSGLEEYKSREVNAVEALGFIDAYLSPHCEEAWKRESEIKSLKRLDKVGLSLSNCSAIEIVGDGYRVICSDPADSAFKPYVLRTFCKDGEILEEKLDPSSEFKPLAGLLSMD